MPIKDALRHTQPFTELPSNFIHALVLSYVGRTPHVVQILRQLNHTGRAFVVQQKGMPGFLLDVHTNIMSWLHEEQLKKSNSKKGKAANLQKLQEKLSALPRDEREDFVKEEFPKIYCKALK